MAHYSLPPPLVPQRAANSIFPVPSSLVVLTIGSFPNYVFESCTESWYAGPDLSNPTSKLAEIPHSSGMEAFFRHANSRGRGSQGEEYTKCRLPTGMSTLGSILSARLTFDYLTSDRLPCALELALQMWYRPHLPSQCMRVYQISVEFCR